MTLYKIVSALLEYPQQELLDALPDISALSQETKAITECLKNLYQVIFSLASCLGPCS